MPSAICTLPEGRCAGKQARESTGRDFLLCSAAAGCVILLAAVREKLLGLLASVWFITLVAFCCRAAFLFHQAHLIPPAILASVPFENEVGNVAQALASGQGFCCLFRQPTGPTAWLVPVYPLLLAVIFKCFGAFTVTAFYVAATLNCVFSALACVPVFFAAKRINGLLTATCAAWIWSLFPSGIMMPFEWIWDTSLSALLAATLLWATLRLAEKAQLRGFVAYGLLWGFSLLANPALGAAFPFFLGWIAYRHYRAGGMLRDRRTCFCPSGL